VNGTVSVMGLTGAGAGAGAGEGEGGAGEGLIVGAGLLGGAEAVAGLGVEGVTGLVVGAVSFDGVGGVAEAGDVVEGEAVGVGESGEAVGCITVSLTTDSLVADTGAFSFVGLGAGSTFVVSGVSLTRLCPMVSPVTGQTDGRDFFWGRTWV